jgi:hypothetical protein
MAHTLESAVDLDLVRVPGDRRLYGLAGFGTLRLQGFLGRSAIAQSDGRSWKIARRGFWQRYVVATDETGAVCGTFEARSIRRGGTLRWGERELTLRPASSWRERYELAEDDRQLALLDGKGWGKRPVRLTIPDGEALEPGLALFATFVVRGLAEDASGSSGAGASAAVC